jgi:segregation and condensation protein B
MDKRTMESMLEGILFTAGEPLEEKRLCEAMDVTAEELREAAKGLGDYYLQEQRGIRLVRLEDSWQLVSAPEYVNEIRRAMERRKPPQLSPALLEVLGIVAYYQPTTRGYIEQVRGVSSGYSVNALVERGLIEECGRLSAPGRPALFHTTKLFLQTFSLSSLDDLPPLPEVQAKSDEEAQA